MTRRAGNHVSMTHGQARDGGPNISRFIALVTCVAAIIAMAQGLLGSSPSASDVPTAVPSLTSTAAVPPTATSVSSVDPTITFPVTPAPSVTPTDDISHIGIVAGHWGYDQGAVCPDGLQEVDINLDIARRVVSSLQERGYRVDLLEEHDSRLEGYVVDALVSIHADSCRQLPNATPPPTGFKVASVVDSRVPGEERRLVNCLTECYADRTGMVFHASSITGHMTQYHTFYEISDLTPGAIIETGFMWLDHEMLTEQPDLVARGIVDGVVCFLEDG